MTKYPFFETLHDVFASLWKRKGVTLVIITVIGLFIASLYLNTQFSVSIIDKAKDQMSPAHLLRVIMTAGPEATIRGFTPEWFAKMNAIPAVVSASEYYEVTINLRKDGAFGRQTIMEAAELDDLAFGPDRLLIGKGLENERDIVLGKTLADRLGIEKPGTKVTVLLERTSNDAIEPLEVEFFVTGIVKGDDRCYALTTVVKSFDLWAIHATRAFREERRPSVSDFPYAVAFVETIYYAQAEEAVKAMGFTSKDLGQFYVAQTPKSWWGQIDNPTAFPAERVFPFYHFERDMKTWIVLRQDDPRWNQIRIQNRFEVKIEESPRPTSPQVKSESAIVEAGDFAQQNVGEGAINETVPSNSERVLERNNDFKQLFGLIDTSHPVEFVKLETIPNPQNLPVPKHHLFIRDRDEWDQWQRLHAVTPVVRDGFQHIRIMEIRSQGAAISPDAITALNMTKPVFRFVRGGMAIEASIQGNPVALTSASARDTNGHIFQNRWFMDDTAMEIIIGTNDSKLLDQTNRFIPLTITRKNRFGADETLQLPVRIINSASNSMIPSGLANNLFLWQKGEVTFKNGQFLREHEVEAATGTRRAKLFLRSPEDVEALQKEFAPQGFLIDHRLNLIENLRSLEKNMTVFVLMFCGTSFLLCLITLFGYSYMSHAMRRKEFHAMLLMGIPRGCLVRGVGIEGLVYSITAVLFAVFLVLLLATPYQVVLEDVFHMPKGSIEIGLMSTGGMVSLMIGISVAIGLVMLSQAPAMFIAWFDKRPQKM